MDKDVSKSVSAVTFEAIFNSITTPLLVLSRDYTMVACNEARLRATGTTREGTLGRPLFDLFPDNPDDPEAEGVHNLRTSLERVLREKVPDTMAVQKYDIRKPNSSEFEERYWSPMNFPVLGEDGEVEFIIHRVEDVTEFVRNRHRTRELEMEVFLRTQEVQATNLELKTAKEELERKVEERTIQLIQAKEEAERANALKSAFLANMSHEIRTPLNAILGFSSLLRESDLNANERNRYFDTIVSNGTALTRIIDDILDLAKVEAGKLEIEKRDFSIRRLLNEVFDLFKPKAEKKHLQLKLNIAKNVPEEICSDSTRLRQILVNLVGNAIKFTDQGEVRVDLRTTGRAGGRLNLEIDVHDTGVGISDLQQKKLFRPFVQADNSTTRKFGGTGLGLVLSRRLAKALGGNIYIKRAVLGEGSTFTLAFPSMTEAAAAVPYVLHDFGDVVLPTPASLSGFRILAVDDSDDNRYLVEQVLRKNGASVDTAEDGAVALKKVLSETYDLVLMDIQMPVMDGYQAKSALDRARFKIPVVALTAHAMREDREKTTKAGFAAHLTKPLNNQELLATISSLCSQDSRASQVLT